MRGNIPQSLQIQDIELIAIDREARQRQLRGRLFLSREKQRLRAMLRLDAPADLAGSAYLLRERDDGADEMYVYIPALNRVRRVSNDASNGRLWGTDIAYTDLRQIGSAVSLSGTRLAGTELLAGRQTHRLSIELAQSDASVFTALQIWVDAQSCIATRVDFVNGKTTQKRLSVDPQRLQREGPYWYASELTIADLGAGTQTRLKVLGIQLDTGLADRIFSPTSFHLGR